MKASIIYTKAKLNELHEKYPDDILIKSIKVSCSVFDTERVEFAVTEYELEHFINLLEPTTPGLDKLRQALARLNTNLEIELAFLESK